MEFGYITKHRALPVDRRRTEARVQLARKDRTPCIVDAGEGTFLNPDAHRIAFLTPNIRIKDAQTAVRRNLNRVDGFEVAIEHGLGEGFVVVDGLENTAAAPSMTDSETNARYLAPHAVVFSSEDDQDPDLVELDPDDAISEVYQTYRSNDLTLYLWFVLEERICAA